MAKLRLPCKKGLNIDFNELNILSSACLLTEILSCRFQSAPYFKELFYPYNTNLSDRVPKGKKKGWKG